MRSDEIGNNFRLSVDSDSRALVNESWMPPPQKKPAETNEAAQSRVSASDTQRAAAAKYLPGVQIDQTSVPHPADNSASVPPALRPDQNSAPKDSTLTGQPESNVIKPGDRMVQSPSDAGSEQFPVAKPGEQLTFPRDDAAHNGFRTEWWYYSGHLKDDAGKEYGYNLTFFQNRLSPDTPPVYVTHVAITDPNNPAHPFVFDQRMALPGQPSAGASQNTFSVFNGEGANSWRAGYAPGAANSDHGSNGLPQVLQAGAGGNSFQLNLQPRTAPVLQGDNGYMQIGSDAGNSSYYYSYPNMATDGSLTLNGQTLHVTGQTWFDHVWGSHLLDKNENGWQWYSAQLDNNRQVMLWSLRRNDGSSDPHSGGTIINADGSTKPLHASDFSVEATGQFRSPATGATYQSGWNISIPSENLQLQVNPLVQNQELQTQQTSGASYWEGACQITGTQAGRPIRGQGYTELTPDFPDALKP